MIITTVQRAMTSIPLIARTLPPAPVTRNASAAPDAGGRQRWRGGPGGSDRPVGAALTPARPSRDQRSARDASAGIVASSARVSATTRSWKEWSRTCADPSMGWPFSS